jgi:hypothetical protein
VGCGETEEDYANSPAVGESVALFYADAASVFVYVAEGDESYI